MLVGICMCIYFFDIFGLSFLIAPEYNREFGLIENIQLLILLAIMVLSYQQFRKANTSLLKSFFILMSIGSVFIFLEEIDYGLHYYDYFVGKTGEQLRIEAAEKSTVRNLHNQGSLTKTIKLFAYVSFTLLTLSPFVFERLKVKNKLINFLVPEKFFIGTLLSMLALNRLALYMDKFLKDSEINSLNSNVSEFEEVFIYYIVFMYLLEKSALLLKMEKEDTFLKDVKMAGSKS